MYGAIIGDLAGSIYEFDQTKKISTISINKIIEDNSFYSDDTILTIAILDAILNNDRNYEKYIKKYIKKYLYYKPNYKTYFKTAFSPQLVKWYQGEIDGLSKGNGAMMRISPIGYLFNTEYEVTSHSLLATIPSHNSIEAIVASRIVTLIIYYGRLGMTKKEIISKIGVSLEYQPFNKFNTICSDTLPNCLYALFSSKSFEESIEKVISFGGDTDTNACIVGSMAEVLYGIDDSLILLAKKKIPDEFVDVLENGYKRLKKLTLR